MIQNLIEILLYYIYMYNIWSSHKEEKRFVGIILKDTKEKSYKTIPLFCFTI